MNDETTDIDSTIKNRAIARKMANEAASRGDPIAGAMEALEHLTKPFYLGQDAEENDEDLDVFP